MRRGGSAASLATSGVYIPPVLEIGHVYPGEWFGEEVVRASMPRAAMQKRIVT